MRSTTTTSTAAPSPSPFVNDRDGLLFDDVFGGPPKYSTSPNPKNDFDYDSIFKSSATNNDISSSGSSKTVTDGPVYDKPVYDDDIFEGLPRMKSESVSSSNKGMKFEDDVFASIDSKQKRGGADQFDDLLGNFGRSKRGDGEVRSSSMQGMDDLLGSLGRNEKAKSSGGSSGVRDFDDLLGGFSSDSSGVDDSE